ncbi:MAG TPA: hypothetical protein VFB50_03510 [Chloroflexota bacterium]|nr:hypothetical protein [Chloroflexota bacterium]
MTTALSGAAGAYFAWRHHHPRESEDMASVWGAAWRAGGRAALQDSARLVDLMPVLRELLCLLEDGRVEDVLRRTDRRPMPAWEDDKEFAF